MNLTDKQVADAAFEYCKLRQEDPHRIIQDSAGNNQFLYMSKIPQIRNYLLLQQAIEKAVTDKVKKGAPSAKRQAKVTPAKTASSTKGGKRNAKSKHK